MNNNIYILDSVLNKPYPHTIEDRKLVDTCGEYLSDKGYDNQYYDIEVLGDTFVIVYANTKEAFSNGDINTLVFSLKKEATIMKNENIMRVKLTTIDEILGSQPNDKEIYSNYIASKAPNAPTMEEEIEAFGTVEVDEKGMTVFPRNEDGVPCLYNYQIKGFFKAACQALRKVPGTNSSKVKAFKKLIDQNVFVYPNFDDPKGRMIPIDFDGEIGICQRPLRASTPQGERIALASSESINDGATIEFDIYCMNNCDFDLIREWLDYGRFNGLSQWRNSGKGAFIWEEIE